MQLSQVILAVPLFLAVSFAAKGPIDAVANSEQPKVRVPRDKKSRQEGDVYAKQATPDQLCEARQHPR